MAEAKGEPENPEAHAIILEMILMLLLFFLQTQTLRIGLPCLLSMQFINISDAVLVILIMYSHVESREHVFSP